MKEKIEISSETLATLVGILDLSRERLAETRRGEVAPFIEAFLAITHLDMIYCIGALRNAIDRDCPFHDFILNCKNLQYGK